jgi:hypothetical protein
MRQCSTSGFRPDVERLEAKQPLSASPSTAPLADLAAGPRAAGSQQAETAGAPRAHLPVAGGGHQRSTVKGVTLERITNPTPFNAQLIPPFDQVLVQVRKPVPGQVYNALFISIRNSTKKTFDASDGLTVRTTDQPANRAVPILTGDAQWRPGQVIVVYQLTKKYYPLAPTESSGFLFNFVHPQVIAIPGPSGIFQRIRYKPDTFHKVLDTIVATGPGSRGHLLGLPDTAIWEIIPASAPVIPL